MRNKPTDNQIEIIKENYKIKGVKYCIDKTGLPKGTVSTIARRYGITVDSDVVIKNKSLNLICLYDYISVTDPSIAYILGLLWTDGSVCFSNNKSKTPVVKHGCISKDSESSDRIFKKLGWRTYKSKNDKSIGKSEMSINWISSRDLGNYLISNNYKDKDNGTYIYNNFQSLTSHFLRGIIDGDGCITISNSGDKYKQTAIYISSTVNQNWGFIGDILDSISVKYKIRRLKDIRGESSQLLISDSLSIYNMCEFIYKDSIDIRLERKYHKYMEFIDYKKSFMREQKIDKILGE